MDSEFFILNFRILLVKGLYHLNLDLIDMYIDVKISLQLYMVPTASSSYHNVLKYWDT